MLQVTFFYMKHVKTRSFWVSLRRENKPEKYVGIQSSTLSQARFLMSLQLSPFSVCNFDKQSFFAFIVLTVEL